METLSTADLPNIAGGSFGEWFTQQVQYAGYTTGYAAGYFYNNVMIGNGVVDDMAKMVR